MEKFTPLARNFTLPPALTALTNFTSALLIYGSFGVKVAEHQVHQCSNRNKLNPCRIGAFYGYITIDGEKIHT